MKTIFRTASFFFILTVFVSPKIFAQALPYHVLFESFTNSNEPCPDPNRAPFENAVTSEASGNSKIVYLNYHVSNLADQLAVLDNGGGSVDARLTGTTGGAIYTCAVNRSIFPEDGERVDPPTTGTGSYSDWGTEINSDYQANNGSPEASITFNYATLDKTNNQAYKLHVDLTVTANADISDSLIIRYAIAQDNMVWTPCSKSPTTYNNVARYVSTSNASNYIVCTYAGMSAGATKHMTGDITIDMSDPLEKPADMKVIAFLEDDGGGDYYVANADVLRQDLDTLQPPPPTLTLTESTISGDTLHPGTIAQIYFASSNLPLGANAFYSLDNGANYTLIADSQHSPISWPVPNSLTTQGKIKLEAVGFPNLTSTEIGTFMIASAPSIGFTHPLPNQVIQGDTTYTVTWVENSVTGAKLQYSLDNGATFKLLGDITGTSYVWHVPDTNAIVELQLVPDNNEAPATAVFDTIKILGGIKGSVSNSTQPSGLTITSVFPNPAMNGAEIVVQYTQTTPKPVTVQFLDLLGHTMPQSYSSDGQEIHLNTNSLMPGAYIVRLSDGVNTVSKRVEVIR